MMNLHSSSSFIDAQKQKKNMTMSVSLSSSFVDAQKQKNRTIMNVGSLLSFIYRSLEKKKKTIMNLFSSFINAHKEDDNNLSSSIDA